MRRRVGTLYVYCRVCKIQQTDPYRFSSRIRRREIDPTSGGLVYAWGGGVLFSGLRNMNGKKKKQRRRAENRRSIPRIRARMCGGTKRIRRFIGKGRTRAKYSARY